MLNTEENIPVIKLLQQLSPYVPYTNENIEIFLQYFQVKIIKKKQAFLTPGYLTKYVGWVSSGCLRSYTLDDNGFEHILQFAPDNWWITDMLGFVKQTQGCLYVDAVLDSELLVLTRENQLKLFKEIPAFESYFRTITENALISTQLRLMSNLSAPAAERYQNFCTTYPNLINIIPQKQVAAFIGVTPEFLSKLKKQNS